ncbi:MAG: MFS transporter [Anaerolineae bacterium]
MIDTPPPRRVLPPLGLAVCLSLFGDLTLFAVLVSQLDVVGLTLGAAGVMLGIHRLIRIAGNPVAGLLYDRWGRRPLFLAGMLLAVLSTTSYGLVRGFWPFLVARLVWGLAWMLINVGGMTMVLDVSTPASRGRWMGIYNTWLIAGLALGPMVGGFLVDTIGYRPGILTCAGITATGLAVALIGLPETDPARPTDPEDTWLITAGNPLHRWAGLLRANTGLLPALALYLIVQFTGEGVVLSTASLLLQQRFGERVALGGLVLGVASAGGLILGLRSLLAGTAGPLAGSLSDARAARGPVIAGGLVAGLAGFGLMAYATPLALIILGVALGAAGSGAVLATLAALVGDLTPPGRQGEVMGLYAAAGDVGSTAGPFLAFAMVTVIDLQWVYLVCSVAFLIGLGLIWSYGRAQSN